MLRDTFFRFLSRLASPSGRRFPYGVAVLLSVASLLLLPRLGIQTTRQGMVRDDLPVQAAFLDYMEEFGTPTQLVVVLEGAPESLKAAADAVARRLEAETAWVRNVFYRVDLEPFRESGLYFLDRETLEAVRDWLAARPGLASTLLRARSFGGLLDEVGTAAGGASVDVIEGPALPILTGVLDAWQATLDGRPPPPLELGRELEALAVELSGRSAPADPDGYLLSTDRELAFLFVQQAESTDEASFVLPFMDAIRGAVDEALSAHPGVAAGFTGWPAAIEEDYRLLLHDLPRISVVASVAILAIFLLAFRSLYRTLLVFVPLGAGVLWTLGATVVAIGHLNYLSSVFVGVLFGLGIDFGIYFLRRFDEERWAGADPTTAVDRTMATAGQGIVVGGLTAIVAFLAVGFTDQPAFAELGLVAGMGVAAVLAATLLLLPPLLVQFPPRRRRPPDEEHSRLLLAVVGRLLHAPRITFAVFVGLGTLLALAAPRVAFDYDLNNLLPAESESLRVLRDMEGRSPYSDQFVVVIADDLEQVRRLEETLAEADTVARVESAAALLPRDPETKRDLLGEIAALWPGPLEAPVGSTGIPALRGRLDDLLDLLWTAEEDAFAAGQTEAMEVVGELAGRFERIGGALGGPDAAARQRAFEETFFSARDRMVEGIEQRLTAEPITLETLDPQLRERFVGTDGHLATLAFPSQPIWDPAFLDRFVEEVRERAATVLGSGALDERVTGFAVTYQVTAPAIRRGFLQATFAALVVVLFMLLVDLRSLGGTLVAAAPLAATGVVLLGGLALLGIPLTMATQVAFPILFGLGVAYGVHMSHRLREEGADHPARAVATTGRAIGLAAATTMAGFGSMMLAEHSALVGLGRLLSLGILVSALAAIGLSPVLFELLEGRPRDRPEALVSSEEESP